MYICAADRRKPANPNDRSVSSLGLMPPSCRSSPSNTSSDSDSDDELVSIESESKSHELPDENQTLEELTPANGQQLEFPAGVPAEVMRSVEERLKQLPFETPGCTLPLVYPRADPTSALYLVLAEELQARGDGMQPSHLTTDCIVTIQGHEFVCVQYLLAHAMTPAALNFFQDAACAAMTKEWHAVVFNVHAGGAALAVCPHTPSRAQPHPPCAEPASLHVQPVSMIKATRAANEQDKAVGSPFVGAGSRNWLCRLMDSETGEFKPGELAFLPLVDAVQAMRRAAPPRASFRLRVSTASPRASAPSRPAPRVSKLQPVEPAVETPGDEDDDDDHDDDEDVTPYTDGSLCRVQSGRKSRSNYPRYLLVAVSSTKPLRYKAAPGQKGGGWAENRTFRHAQLQLEATSEEVVERTAKAAREEQVKQEAHEKKEKEQAAKKERAEKLVEAKQVRDEAKRVRKEEARRKVLLTKRKAEEKKHEQEEKQKQRDAEQAEKERLEEAQAAKVKDALMKAAKAAEAAAKAKTAESEREKKELLAAVAKANKERLAAEAKAKAERLAAEAKAKAERHAAQKAQKEAEAQVAALKAELAKKGHNRTEPDPEEEPEQKRNKSSGRVASPGPSTPPVKARSRRSPSSSASPSSRASVVQRREELAALEDAQLARVHAQLARARVRVQHDEREKDRDRRRRRRN